MFSRTRQNAVASVFLLVACVLTAARLIYAAPGVTIPAAICLLCYLLIARGHLTRSGFIFLGLLVVIGAAIWWQGFPDSLLLQAIDRGLFLTFFVVSMTMLRVPANRSDTVARCGHAIVNQRPGLRYLALTTGAQMFGVILNLGSISLLGSMTNRALPKATNPQEERRNAVRVKRMSLAILRGFSPVAMWSPTSLTLAILLEMQPGVAWIDYLPYGLSATVGFLVLGAAMDWLFYPTPVHRPEAPGLGFTLISVARFCLIVAAVFGVAVTVSYALDITTILGILISVPFSSLVWLGVQKFRHGPGKTAYAWKNAALGYTRQLGEFSTEVAIFFSAGAMSVLIGPLFHADELLIKFVAADVDPAIILAGVCTGIVVLGAIGVTPFLSVILAAATLFQMPVFSAQGMVTTLALGMAWSGSLGLSPFMASTRLVAQFAGTTSTELCLHWNRNFSLVWVLVMNGFIFLAF